MKKALILTAAALTVFAACTKEKDFVTESKLPAGLVKASFIAEVDQTKATEDAAVFSWTSSDSVAVVAKDSDVKRIFLCTNTTDGVFDGSLGENQDFGFAISPYQLAGDMIEDSGDVLYDVNFKSTYYDYVPGTTHAVMVGTPNGAGKFLFRHLAATLRFNIVNVPVGTAAFRLTTDKKITGTATLDATSNISVSDLGGGNTVTLNLKYPISAPNTTKLFYVPVPVGNYTSMTVEFLDDSSNVLDSKIKTGLNLNVARGDVYYTPTMTLDAVTINKGAEWAYTFEQKVFSANGTQTLSGTTDQDWTLAGDGSYWGYDGTKGQQFGSGSAPYSSMTITSNFGATYGISDVKINTSGASSIAATVSVSVGGVAFECEAAETVDLTTTATDYTFSSPDGNNYAGDVVISYVQTSAKAIYLKSITINPAAQLPQVATPTFSPAGGSYTETQNVTISCETADATIYYTLDGTDPSNQSSVYTSAIEISATTTVKAIAVKEGMADSEIASATYSISGSIPTTGWVETALADITSSDVFVIVGNNGDNYAMNHTTLNNSGAPTATAVSVTGSALSADPSDELKWNLSSDASGYMFYPDGVTDKWLNLIANNNGLRVSNTAANGKYWSLDAASGYLIGTDTADATRYIGIYNSTDWRSYTSINSNIASQTIKFYKYVSAPDNRQEAGMSWSQASASASIEDGDVVQFTAPTLNNPNSVAPVSYSSTDTDVAEINVYGTVTVKAAGTTNIQAIFTGDTDYKPQTVEYVLTVTDNRTPVVTYAFETVAQLNALATSTEAEKFGRLENAVVSFVPNTGNAIIKDATGSVLLYKSNHGLLQGQTFSGDVTVTVKLYNSCSELTACDASFTGSQTAVAPATPTLSQLVGHLTEWQNAYVQVSGLEVTAVDGKNVTVTDNANSYVVYSSATNASCVVGDVITVTGTVSHHSDKDQITAWSTDAIVVTYHPVASHTITISQPEGAAATAGCSIAASANDSSVASGASLQEGTVVTITATEGTDYSFVSWTVTGATVSDASANPATFTVGTADVTISATFKDDNAATPDPETIVFADLGLTNGDQYSDPFNGGNFTVTFGGGGNDGKYYDTGSGIRTYANGTITVASSYTIAKIEYTFSGSSNAPASGYYSVNGGSLSPGQNSVWTGSSTNVVLTNTASSGHWRLQSVKVTYSGGGSTPPTPETYAVTWTVPSNGTIAATVGGNAISSGDEFEAGTTVNITATPSTGYKFSAWSITGASLASPSSASTSFTVGSSDVNFSASFAQDQQTGGDPVVESITSGTFTSANDKLTLTLSSGVTIEQSKVSGNTAVNATYNTVSTLRVYKGHALTFTGKTFTRIEIKVNGTYYGNTLTANTGTLTPTTTSGGTIVWVGESDSVVITNNATSTNTQLRTTSFTVTYN